MLEQDLLAIERRLWTGGPDEYQGALDDTLLMGLTAMAGVTDRDTVAGTVEPEARWRDLDLQVEGVLRPTDDVALITYRAQARRGDAERYRALVSSGYVRRDGGWKLMFHQQTPLLDAGP